VNGLTVEDALTPNIVAVGEDMRPRHVAIDPRGEVFAVFKELPSSLAALQPPFLGLIEPERVGRYPLRIFADLVPRHQTFMFERSTPLAHVVSRFEHFSANAVAVLGSQHQFVGVVTRRSLLETLLEHEHRLRRWDFNAPAGPTMLSPELPPIEDTTPPGKLRSAVQRLATEWILSENRDQQHLAGDIHDRLRQLLIVARLHLDQAQRPASRGQASGSLTIVDQLLEESLAYTRLLIEELTPSGLRTGQFMSALEMLALDMRHGSHPVHVANVPSDIRLSEPITIFLYRAARSFLRQAIRDGVSSLITLSMEGEPASIIRVRVAINGETRTSETEQASLLGETMGMCFAGIQARGTLLGIAVSVETSLVGTTALVLDVPLQGSSGPL
jgi:signal transduction histidine kinase